MSRSKCTVCARDISRPSLVRCRESRCPLTPRRARASTTVLLGLGGLGGLILLSIALASWMFASPAATPGDGPGNMSESDAPKTPREAVSQAGSGVAAWMSTLISAPKQHGEEAAPVDRSRDSGLPDPRAATLVMTFPCTGAVSPSRSRICTDWSLATADYNLSLLYRSTLARSKNPEALRRDNATWLAKLDRLTGDTEALLKFYSDWRDDIARH